MKCKPYFIFIPIVLFFVISAAVMLLWNSLLPTLLNLPTVSYWQAMGLLVLSRLLLGSWSFGGKRKRDMRHRYGEKWMNMNAEEKEKIKQEWQKRCKP